MAGRFIRRRAYLVGCEGESERAYAAFLDGLAKDRGRPIHLERVLLRGGDPLSLLQRLMTLRDKSRMKGVPGYRRTFLMFDTDALGRNLARDRQMTDLAQRESVTLIRQDVCFESLLLRHVDGMENAMPAAPGDALRQLQREWPDYRKGVASQYLRRKLDVSDVMRAANSPRNLTLRELVEEIGLE